MMSHPFYLLLFNAACMYLLCSACDNIIIIIASPFALRWQSFYL